MMKFMVMFLMLMMFNFYFSFWFMLWLLFMFSFIYMFMFYSICSYVEISYLFGIDLLSYSMILLSFWICSLMMLASGKMYKNNDFYKIFMGINLLLLFSLVLTFCSMNLFLFYLFFEISLIPILILIIGWGYQPERLEAGIYLLFYTLLFSLPMMIILFYLYFINKMLMFFMLGELNYLYMYMFINMVFFVKIPMFFMHLWLPKAHVEAPVSGSMILAGIMLKLGGYGLMRFMMFFQLFLNNLNIIIMMISLIGGVFISFICIRQSDIKSLIAYSSVCHMSLVLAGIMSINCWGMWGALGMMVAHGLCSSGLFCLANILYERTLSRSLYMNKGLLNLIPGLSMWWFLLLSSNMAAPPSLNLLSEIILINNLVSVSSYLMILLILISFLSAAYSLFLYSYIQHGMLFSSYYFYYNIFNREYLLLILHWLPLNMLFLKGDILFEWI
uniref:NADH-ubiquinone oxidoreductase chain 4 n=1 Tax=Hyphasis sp. REN-2018 TaxID=2506507 RepID=A0A411DA35_9CUCU|nr:NADH dehydrogenase subunit 4 [Hyphasis sp. REN-2018]